MFGIAAVENPDEPLEKAGKRADISDLTGKVLRKLSEIAAIIARNLMNAKL